MQPWNVEVSVNKSSLTHFGENASCFPGAPYVYESTEVRITRLSAESMLAFLGIIGNVIVCFVKLGHSNINNAIGNYIRNLALADIGVLVLGYPFAVAKEQEATHGWWLGEFGCLYVYPLTETFYGVSIWTLVAIAVERYHIFKGNNLTWNSRGGKHRGCRILVVLWFTAFVVLALPLIFVSKTKHACGKLFCFIRWPSTGNRNNIPPMIHSLCLLVALFILPVVLIAWSYCKVSMPGRRSNHSRSHFERMNSINSSLLEEEESRRLQITETKRLHAPLVILFVITMIPINVLRLLLIFWDKDLPLEHYLVLFNISIMFTISNSVARPCIYYVASQDIREGYRRVFRRFRRCYKWRRDETLVSLQDLGVEVVSVTSTSSLGYKETTL